MFGVRQLEETREFGVRGLALATGLGRSVFQLACGRLRQPQHRPGDPRDEWPGLVALGFAAAV
jgi:hypothetical protein